MIKNKWIELKRAYRLIWAACGLAIISSCADDTVVEKRPVSLGDEIVFKVASDSLWKPVSNKAGMSSRATETSFLGMIGEDSLYISMIVEDNDTPIFPEKEDTLVSRGKAYADNEFTSFQMKAWLDNGDSFINQEVTRDPSTKTCTYSPVKYWPENNKVHFLGYAWNKDIENFSLQLEDDGDASFSYTLPSPITIGDDAYKDAINQPDLIMAYNPDKSKMAVNQALDLKFKHALSAVVFKIGEVPANVTITKVEFSDVYGSGTCTLHITEGAEFTWKQSDEAVKQTYTQTFDQSAANGTSISETNKETCFMMIPQKFGDNAEITIYFKVQDRPYTLERTLKSIVGSSPAIWEPNKKYTYTISLPEEVKVEVSDELNPANTIKSKLNITNTGISPVYIRVTFIGNWVTEKVEADNSKSYEVVADWTAEDGIFDWGNGGEPPMNATVRNWRKGSDGFYYYMTPLERGKSVPQDHMLFKTYTLTRQVPTFVGSMLDFTIAVQAIHPDDYEAIWPDDIKNALGTGN